MKNRIAIIGGGLAGCECALTLAGRGIESDIFEQKPQRKSAAHVSDSLAELVCSNSFRSDEETSGIGLLKKEMRSLGSFFMQAADACRLPAGKAFAVDREKFSARMTKLIMENPHISLKARPVDSLDDEVLAPYSRIVIAAGPLASSGLAASLGELTGREWNYFYDAIAPIVWTDSLNHDIVFRASRYDEGADGDYLNCPMNREEYERFYAALSAGKTFDAHGEDREIHFDGCMPIEALAARGPKTLSFGPMKPVGLKDPRTGTRPWAVLQLRAEQINRHTCNLVGCQTKLLQKEQERIFRLVPGLEKAEFARYGSMHRNTFVNAPVVLKENLELRSRRGAYLAGQITGVEGYVESAATGLWLGLLLAAEERGERLKQPPNVTALGALLGHLQRESKNFQPSNINFGLMPEPHEKMPKKLRKSFYASRAMDAFAEWMNKYDLL